MKTWELIELLRRDDSIWETAHFLPGKRVEWGDTPSIDELLAHGWQPISTALDSGPPACIVRAFIREYDAGNYDSWKKAQDSSDR